MTVTMAGTVDVASQASIVTVTVSSALEVYGVGVSGVAVGELVESTPAAATAEEVGIKYVARVVTAGNSLTPATITSAPAPKVVVATGASEVVRVAIEASEVVETRTGAADVEGMVTGASEVDEVEALGAAPVDATIPDDPKLLDAGVEAPLLTSTFLRMTTSPSSLVTLTSTAVVPNPLDCSKKLYDWRVVVCQVLPPSVLTSRLATALLALTTCMENQYAETPSLLWSSSGEVMGQSTKSHVTSIIPLEGLARSAKASGKRSTWFKPQPGHSSTI